jgi:hypothetical protein
MKPTLGLHLASMLLLPTAWTAAAAAQTANPTPPASPPTGPAATATTEPPAAPPPPELPTRLGIGSADGYFRPGLLLQGWYVADFAGTNADQIDNQFRMRRAELSARGHIIPGWLSYRLMIDPAKVLEFGSATIDVENQDPPPTDPENPEQVTVRQPVSAVSMFQDFFVTLETEWLDVSLGQFKVPVSWEGYGSSSRLLFPERAAVSRRFGDRRDLGLRFAKSFEWLGYSVGVFNGQGQNNFDTNNSKDLALRLEVYPWTGLTVAGVVYMTVGDREQSGTKDRYEADLRFDYAGFLLQAEYIYGHDVGSSGADVYGHGFYAAVAYTFLDAFQPCARVGWLDPDVDADGTGSADELWQIDAGFNWLIRQHDAKLQLSYTRFQYDQQTANNQLLLAAQVGF